MKYSGDITGGSLLIRESRIAARILLDLHDPALARAAILKQDLLQNGSPETTRKYCRLILPRLAALPEVMLRFVADGSDELVRLTLLAAVLKTVNLVADFMLEVVGEKVRCYDPQLSKADWTRFLESKATVDPAVAQWSESSRRKMGQVVLRMLAEAGFLQSTKAITILSPAIPHELLTALEAEGDGQTIRCLRPGK